MIESLMQHPVYLLIAFVVVLLLVRLVAETLANILFYVGTAILAFCLVFVWTADDYDQGLGLSERLNAETYQTVMSTLSHWDDFRGMND